MEEIIETKRVTTYIGACPICRKTQKSQSSGDYVDSICNECAIGAQCKQYEPLILNAEVISADFNTSGVSSIVIESSTGHRFKLCTAFYSKSIIVEACD